MNASTSKVPHTEASHSWRRGVSAGLPFAPPTLLLGITFGVLAKPVMGMIAPIAMSASIFAGGAQFAALSVLSIGGGSAAAIAAGVLINARLLAMGFAVGPSLSGRAPIRALKGQAIVDASFAIASRGDGTFDPGLLIGATLPQASAWIAGTILGVFGGSLLPASSKALGLDAIFPAFYLALLIGELENHPGPRRRRQAIPAALGGAAITIALTGIAPPGLPIIAASLAALIGLHRS